ncbi:MAG: hypothetical protein H7Y16_09080 [Candidatus Parcubacteria bacterium]|nr:hypothetical protein [Burkholderiales bacterium]
MKLALTVLSVVWAGTVFAQTAKPDSRVKEDIAAHRAIAAAHEKAAKCLESGKSEKECHAPLAIECKSVAIGKYCGMRHRH